MNTRVQVEHSVTEMTTGVDIVKTGIRIAAGEVLPLRQEDVVLRGHAIECRINAEDAARRFVPSPGRIASYQEPSGPGVRVDSGVRAGSEVSATYDPMIAKLIVWDSDRDAATRRMLRALGEFEITGLTTLIPFHERLLATEQWARGETCRELLEDDQWLSAIAAEPPVAETASPAAVSPRLHGRGRRAPLRCARDRPAQRRARRPRRARRRGQADGAARSARHRRARAPTAATCSPARCRGRC